MMAEQGTGIRTAFREELTELRDTVLEMATFVEGMLSRAMESLVNQDYDLAEEVRVSDDIPDDLDLAIENLATRLLALQQPLARDLRAIMSAVRISADLERVGDYSKDIAKVARRLVDEPYFKPLEDIPKMAELTREMLRGAVRCFVNRDLELAREVAEMDNEVDDLWRSLRDELMDFMRSDPKLVRQAMYLLLVARYLERIGDHTVNVVERVHYMETGELKHLC
jgi:phosphate transport system protein